jgi:hypothetical protein
VTNERNVAFNNNVTVSPSDLSTENEQESMLLQTKTGTHLKKILAKIQLLWTTQLAGTFTMMCKSRKSTHLKVSSHPTLQQNPSKAADISICP